mgnify:CR=1 FL=1
MAVLLAVLGVVKRRQHEEAVTMVGGKLLFAKKGSWNVKSFRMMAFDEREIVGGVRDENLIGSGGSGNVYRVKLGCGTVVAVKHITRTRAAAAASAGPTAAMLPRSASASARQCREFAAEAGTGDFLGTTWVPARLRFWPMWVAATISAMAASIEVPGGGRRGRG